jgi:muramoyltetrapeptide carboxypeptidase LdcA involved in peptidoglycan recycling
VNRLSLTLRIGVDLAIKHLSDLGLCVVFAKHVREIDEFKSAPVSVRFQDLHEAIADQNFNGVITAIGGYNCNQLLKYLERRTWEGIGPLSLKFGIIDSCGRKLVNRNNPGMDSRS